MRPKGKTVTVPDVIRYDDLTIREYKYLDKYNLFAVLNEYRRDYMIHVYKKCFKSWFTYAVCAIIMSISYSTLSTSLPTIFTAPLIITVLLLYKVNKYRKECRHYSIYDIENMVLESSSVKRKQTQGCYVCLLGDELISYCIYVKQNDELETVCIKEICVAKAYRAHKVAKNFVKYLCKNVFFNYGYRRLTFNVSNFHVEMNKIIAKKYDLFACLYSFNAYKFVPGVRDDRNAYGIDFEKIENL